MRTSKYFYLLTREIRTVGFWRVELFLPRIMARVSLVRLGGRVAYTRALALQRELARRYHDEQLVGPTCLRVRVRVRVGLAQRAEPPLTSAPEPGLRAAPQAPTAA